MPSVIEKTVDNLLCVGCGVCVALCPEANLSMQWNSYGELNPVKIRNCKHDCGFCLSVCPSQTTKKNDEDVISQNLYNIPETQHRPEVGYYLTTGAGGVSDKERRAECASGGLATWFLAQLLKRDIVDAVICVNHCYDGTKLFHYTVAETIEDVLDSKGSSYYPNELSDVLKYILANDKRYAVIALPCSVKAIRLAQKQNKKLNSRIVVTAALVCGRMKTSVFTDYCSWLSKLDGKPTEVQYRITDLSAPPLPHRYVFRRKHRDGTETKTQITHKVGTEIYHSSLFGLTACRFCDDMFGECADISFMDAWLHEYTSTEPRGTSLFVTRTPLAAEIIDTGIQSGELAVSYLPVQKIIQSQGGLKRRDKISYMQTLHRKDGFVPPYKRFVKTQVHGLAKIEARRYAKLDLKSRKVWEAVNHDFAKYHRWVSRQRLISFPARAFAFGIRMSFAAVRKIVRTLKN